MIDLAVSADDRDDGMTLAELESALARLRSAGAPDDQVVLVYANRAHRLGKVEARLFDSPNGATHAGDDRDG